MSNPTGVAEIWQNQRYWPIRGWGLAMGIAHFTGDFAAANNTSDTPFATLPSGWDWSGDWIIDTSKSFGETDAEGWVYGTSFEKILEMIASNTTTGICSSTSIFRRRCWRRKMVCTSEEIATSVEKRRTRLTASRQAVVEILTEKQSKVDSVKKYEAQRIVAHKKAYITSTHTVKYVETSVKEHSTKLKILRQFICDRVAMEKDYARKLDLLVNRYGKGNNNPVSMDNINVAAYSSSSNSTSNMSADKAVEVKQNAEVANNVNNFDFIPTIDSPDYPVDSPPIVSTTSRPSSFYNIDTSSSLDDSGSEIKASHTSISNSFFDHFAQINDNLSVKLKGFTVILTEGVLQDIDKILKELNELDKICRIDLKHDSDSWKKYDDNVRMANTMVSVCFELLSGPAIATIGQLSEELNGLNGAGGIPVVGFHDDIRSSTSANSTNSRRGSGGGMMSSSANNLLASGKQEASGNKSGNSNSSSELGMKEDLWLSIQRYRRTVASSEAFLQIFSFKVGEAERKLLLLGKKIRRLFIMIIDVFANDLVGPWSAMGVSLHALHELTIKHHTQSNEGRWNDMHGKAESEVETPPSRRKSMSKFVTDSLFSLLPPLPPLPKQLLHGRALLCSSNQLRKCTHSNPLPEITDITNTKGAFQVKDLVWIPVTVILSTDGFLHILKIDEQQKLAVPLRSLCVKNQVVSSAYTATGNLINGIELRPLATNSSGALSSIRNMISNMSIHDIDGVVLYTFDDISADKWMTALTDPLGYSMEITDSFENNNSTMNDEFSEVILTPRMLSSLGILDNSFTMLGPDENQEAVKNLFEEEFFDDVSASSKATLQSNSRFSDTQLSEKLVILERRQMLLDGEENESPVHGFDHDDEVDSCSDSNEEEDENCSNNGNSEEDDKALQNNDNSFTSDTIPSPSSSVDLTPVHSLPPGGDELVEVSIEATCTVIDMLSEEQQTQQLSTEGPTGSQGSVPPITPKSTHRKHRSAKSWMKNENSSEKKQLTSSANSDKLGQPLSTKRSLPIKKYEEGLLASHEREISKVSETRGKTLNDFGIVVNNSGHGTSEAAVVRRFSQLWSPVSDKSAIVSPVGSNVSPASVGIIGNGDIDKEPSQGSNLATQFHEEAMIASTRKN